MDIIILAGGFGTRLSEYTHTIPKPMVIIGDRPILNHIINLYVSYEQKSFYIAMGYKSEEVIKHFVGKDGLEETRGDELIRVKDYNDEYYKNGIDISLVNTGIDTMTGGRIKKIKKYSKSNRFMVTYGDGLSDINIKNLLDFHIERKKIGTVTAVRPPARFGELDIEGDKVIKFEEKPQLQKGWINGGFFVFERSFFDLIDDDFTMLEREPMIALTKANNLNAFKHEGFWQCMDTKRDRDFLEDMWNKNNRPWII
jgi:glucose-1-phosphate cytidylyltransferase